MNSDNPFHLLVICRSGPLENARISAAFDLLLTAASFEQKVTAVFMGEGVMNLLATQAQTDTVKNPAKAIGAFELYGVVNVLALDEDLASKNVDIEALPFSIEAIGTSQLKQLVQQANQVLVY